MKTFVVVFVLGITACSGCDGDEKTAADAGPDATPPLPSLRYESVKGPPSDSSIQGLVLTTDERQLVFCTIKTVGFIDAATLKVTKEIELRPLDAKFKETTVCRFSLIGSHVYAYFLAGGIAGSGDMVVKIAPDTQEIKNVWSIPEAINQRYSLDPSDAGFQPILMPRAGTNKAIVRGFYGGPFDGLPVVHLDLDTGTFTREMLTTEGKYGSARLYGSIGDDTVLANFDDPSGNIFNPLLSSADGSTLWRRDIFILSVQDLDLDRETKRIVISGSLSDGWKTLDLESGKTLREFKHLHSGPWQFVNWLNNNRMAHMACGGAGGVCRFVVVDADTNQPSSDTQFDAPLKDMVVTRDKTLLYTAGVTLDPQIIKVFLNEPVPDTR